MTDLPSDRARRGTNAVRALIPPPGRMRLVVRVIAVRADFSVGMVRLVVRAIAVRAGTSVGTVRLVVRADISVGTVRLVVRAIAVRAGTSVARVRLVVRAIAVRAGTSVGTVRRVVTVRLVVRATAETAASRVATAGTRAGTVTARRIVPSGLGGTCALPIGRGTRSFPTRSPRRICTRLRATSSRP
ncbi:hypothetical protein [Microbacterium sp. CCNWLW44]|uniref:hypothetical protein n=1 Tax=Microbacterium sp. CCNWLW44 TaxID=3122068 RepID=UPI00300F9C2C